MSGHSAGAEHERLSPELPDRGAKRVLYALVWVVFLAFPLLDAINSHDSALGRTLTVVAAAVFVAVYAAELFRPRQPVPGLVGAAMIGLQLAIAVTLTLAERYAWASMFIFTVAGGAFILRPPLRESALVLCVALVPALGALDGARAGDVIAFTSTTVGIGVLMLALADLRARNAELCSARAELARLAVAQERLRFARDLHDLLGHSLSVIALKSELAGRLLPERTSEAIDEVRSIERVAREALAEVRETVGGYRQPSLDGEIAGARLALSAAGIEAEVERPAVRIDPEIEAVLAWAVREGATNVIRHSGASRCVINVRAGLVNAGLEMIDDGPGTSVERNGATGNGLAGLAERVSRLRGKVDAGAHSEGGFRLNVTVPLQRT